MTATQQQVMFAINSELEYQKLRWNPQTTVTGGVHGPDDYTIFIDAYLRKAKDAFSFQGEPAASREVLEIARKITAMAISCLVQNLNVSVEDCVKWPETEVRYGIAAYLIDCDHTLERSKASGGLGGQHPPMPYQFRPIRHFIMHGLEVMLSNGAYARVIPDELLTS
jgi:hypothetical protein